MGLLERIVIGAAIAALVIPEFTAVMQERMALLTTLIGG